MSDFSHIRLRTDVQLHSKSGATSKPGVRKVGRGRVCPEEEATYVDLEVDEDPVLEPYRNHLKELFIAHVIEKPTKEGVRNGKSAVQYQIANIKNEPTE